ncbi:glycoside hydrolase family 88 protein [Paenibacillus sp. FA6]|uniref:glycoside hydrolase family 88 protein n=1 Tax=Paenibacillus sp. FA6 TaxID=3413029 RepID=UPI003F65A102
MADILEKDAVMWEKIAGKIKSMNAQIGEKSPHVAGADGKYDDMRIDWWTSGFWPGMLWLAYDMTGDETFKKSAWEWDDRLERKMLEINSFDHDVGFQFLPTAVFKYMLTGDQDGRRKGLAAANFLAGRFNVNGRYIRAWNGDKHGWSIVDSAMNISLLFWAAEEVGDPRFSELAKLHADTIVDKFIREDGSVNHIVSFDPLTGEVIEVLGGQGEAPDSAWSRGAAWALYGMANTYRITKDNKYLKAAQRVAHFFIAHLPADRIPLWDFRTQGSPEQEPRDTSAGAIAASGLLELAALLPEHEARQYKTVAVEMLYALSDHCGTWDNSQHEAILREGTGHKPAGQNVNVSLIYGDYYFAEAFAKLNGWTRRIF